MIETRWDIRRGADTYRQILDARLKSWISAGRIKAGETVVWKSGFSGWRKPEELDELIPYFRRRERIPPARSEEITREGPGRQVVPKRRVRDILIVDDEKDLRELLGDALTSRKHGVTCAGTTKEAIKSIRRHSYDLVFLDLKLPDGDGMKLLPRIRKRNPHAIINIISAYGNPETREKAMKLGASRFIDKPFSEEDIFRAMGADG